MDSFPKTTDPEWPEKQYPYRYSWFSTIFMFLVGGLGVVGIGWMAVSEHKFWHWLLALFFFALFLFSAWIMVVNLLGKLTVRITHTGIYIPSVWKWGSSVYVPFSDISAVELLKIQGNVVLQLSVGRKKYAIAHTWFPHKEDFQEMIEIVQKRLPVLL